MCEVRCIYCNKGASDGVIINESDIIPDSLTNAKLRCSNVCSIEHNNKFSDYFESDVINELAFIRNKLNIKNKGKKFPSYPCELKIGDRVYKKKNFISDSNPLENSVIPSLDGTALFRPVNDLENIKNKPLEVYDLKDLIIEKRTNISLEIFTKDSMFRMVSKIAYEWFCKVNNIMYMNTSFSDIINFITTGISDTQIVTPISDTVIHYPIESLVSKGSHLLSYYITGNNEVKAIVSIFGVALYKVIITPKLENLDNVYRLASQEFDLVKPHNLVKYKNLNGLEKDYNDNFIHICSGEITIPYCVSDMDNDTSNKILLNDRVARYLHNENSVYCEKNFESILISKLNKLLSILFLNKPELKRFSKEYGGNNFENVNWDNSDTDFWLKFYVAYLIGKSDYDNISEDILYHLLNENFNITNDVYIDLSKESSNKWKTLITQNNNFKEIILNGFKTIEKWQ